MKIIGISGLFHDAAAAAVVDGKVVAAAQEERFTRLKHDANLPVNSIKFCLQFIGCELEDLDAIVFYDDPLLKLERCLAIGSMSKSDNSELLSDLLEEHLTHKLWVENLLREEFQQSLGKLDRLLYSKHHHSHAASAFYPSPFESSAILVIDGVGEWATTSIGFGKGKDIEFIKELKFPHSLGLLYSAFTYYCGFKVNSGEYKLMGLAPYGQPTYVEKIEQYLIRFNDDGSFELNMEYFGFVDNQQMINDAFCEVFNEPIRTPESELTQFYLNIAASIQIVLEKAVLRLCEATRRFTKCDNLVLAGGVALNCVSNSKILKSGIFKNIWIQPAAGDAGGSLGAALITYHQYFNQQRYLNSCLGDSQNNSLLGPEYSQRDIVHYLNAVQAKYEVFSNRDELNRETCRLLLEEKVIGYFDGRMEFGPRALGSRSIIGIASSKNMQSKMNLRIKYRESFRPFAPIVAQKNAHKFFQNGFESPYMLLVDDCKDELIIKDYNIRKVESESDLYTWVNSPRSIIPSVTHIDYSARVQTISQKQEHHFYSLLEELEKHTDTPVLINTSFNVRGEPIVCNPQDAYECFMNTDMDILILGDVLLKKKNNLHNEPSSKGAHKLD